MNRREEKGKGEKERYTHLNTEFQRIARRDKKAILSDQCKKIEENNRMVWRRKWQPTPVFLPEELWTEVCDIVQEAGIKIIPKKKKCKKAKWLSEEVLQMAGKRREAKGKGEKERYIHLNAELQRIARGEKKALLSDQCKEIEENNGMGKTRALFEN